MNRKLRSAVGWAAWLVILAFPARAALVESFDDIEFWVGSGTNRAALVLDWKDGKTPESMVWGFRWDGSATGKDMLTSVTAADPRFGGVVMTDWGWGWSLDGLGYDLDGDGFDVLDLDDHYKPGWDGSNYWAYFTYDGSTTPWAAGQSWTYSMVGMADRTLKDGSWDGWRYTNDDTGPSQGVAAVPEPIGVVSFLAGTAVIFALRRTRAHRKGREE